MTGLPLTVNPKSGGTVNWLCADIGYGGPHVPGGTYAFKYSGEASFSFEGDAVVSAAQTVAGRAVVEVTPGAPKLPSTTCVSGGMDDLCAVACAGSGIVLCMNWTNPSNPARDFTMLLLDHEADDLSANPFHPTFLAKLAGATIIRFDSWLKTEAGNNAARSWADRVKPADNQTTKGGIALEYQLLLCNILQAAPWFYLPHAANASDPYLIGFADLVISTLNPDLPIYYEFAHGLGYNSVRASPVTVADVQYLTAA